MKKLLRICMYVFAAMNFYVAVHKAFEHAYFEMVRTCVIGVVCLLYAWTVLARKPCPAPPK